MTNATSQTVIGNYSQSAINSIALEQAANAAKQALKGELPNAWGAASAIANACDALASSNSNKALIFGVASGQAAKAFAVERIQAGALEKESRWLAFGSACSVAKGALEFGVWFDGIGKSEAAKDIKESREARDSASYAMAVQAGIVPAVSTPDTQLSALRAELVALSTEHGITLMALKGAQERLIPLDVVQRAHDVAMSEANSLNNTLALQNAALREEIAKLTAVIATRTSGKRKAAI